MFLIYSAHVVICVLIILVILFQDGKTGGLTGVADNASQQVFGAKGAGNFLTKLTTGLAIAFMFTSLTLALFHKSEDKSIADEFTPVKTNSEQSTAVSTPEEQKTESGESEVPAVLEDGTPAQVIYTDKDGNKKAGNLSDVIGEMEIIQGDDVPLEIREAHKRDLMKRAEQQKAAKKAKETTKKSTEK
ncbi:MAG: preprotein translocase subunit SecG [Acidobacteria bacterium]|nr:MAG: preprotein translocase subunit SecG [Acidobacteriota bacterium]